MPLNKTNAMRLLDQLKIDYDVRTYVVDESDLSAGHVAEQIGLPIDQVFKTLIARTNNRDVVLACVPGSSALDLKALGAVAKAKRAELVALKDVQKLTGYVRGGVSPIGTRKPFPVFLDQSAHLWDTISISAGQRGLQVLIKPDDLVCAIRAVVCELVR